MKLREKYNNEYKFITILPHWSDIESKLSNYLPVGTVLPIDDILWLEARDIRINPERYEILCDAWLQAHEEEFERIVIGLYQVYDPLSNYNMKEEGLISEDESDRIVTTERRGSEETTTSIPSTRSSRYTTTDDNANPDRLESYTVNAPNSAGEEQTVTVKQIADEQGKKGVESISSHGDAKTATGPIHTTAGEFIRDSQLVRSGNIGVTTNQQMLEAEISLRMVRSFCSIFVEMFVRDCTEGVYEL